MLFVYFIYRMPHCGYLWRWSMEQSFKLGTYHWDLNPDRWRWMHWPIDHRSLFHKHFFLINLVAYFCGNLLSQLSRIYNPGILWNRPQFWSTRGFRLEQKMKLFTYVSNLKIFPLVYLQKDVPKKCYFWSKTSSAASLEDYSKWSSWI